MCSYPERGPLMLMIRLHLYVIQCRLATFAFKDISKTSGQSLIELGSYDPQVVLFIIYLFKWFQSRDNSNPKLSEDLPNNLHIQAFS